MENKILPEDKMGTLECQQLLAISEQIHRGIRLAEIFDFVYDSFQEIIPYDRIGIAFLVEDDEIVRSAWAKSHSASIHLPEGYRAALQGSSLESILRTGQPRVLNDLAAYLAEHPESHSTRLIRKEGIQSSLTCPLIARDKPIGFIFFSSRQKRCYADSHVAIYLKVAGQLALAIEKSRLYERVLELGELKDRFVGIAAHDLRSPIGTVKNLLSLFLHGYLGEMNERQSDMLQRIDGNCDRMMALINDLLDISAIESGKLELERETVDLRTYLKRAVQERRNLAKIKSIDLTLGAVPAELMIPLDRRRIDQVLDNLITNAIKFSYPDTQITIFAEQAEKFVEIAVRDQGQGIPQAELAKLFADFSRTSVKPTAGERSTGLGLAIVRRIARAHGGQVSVQSEVGKGSTFRIRLPLTPEAEPAI